MFIFILSVLSIVWLYPQLEYVSSLSNLARSTNYSRLNDVF